MLSDEDLSAQVNAANLLRRLPAEALIPGTSWPPRKRTWRHHILLFPPVHSFWYATRWIGLRSRLRCPECKAVGTWKPHGTYMARWGKDKDRPVRRWLCKWCGHYIGPEGILHAWPDKERGYWCLPRPYDPNSSPDSDETPADVLKREMGKTWPWRG